MLSDFQRLFAEGQGINWDFEMKIIDSLLGSLPLKGHQYEKPQVDCTVGIDEAFRR